MSEDRTPSSITGAYSNFLASNPEIQASFVEYIKAQGTTIGIREGDQKTDIELGPKTDLHMEVTREIEEHGSSVLPGLRKIIPKIRKCNITNFKNRFKVHEGRYAVDVLESNSFLDQEIQEEIKLRQSLPKKQAKNKDKLSKSKSKLVDTAASLVDKAIHTDQSDTKWISRIRIQSPAILSILSKIMRESPPSKPLTFFRPFSPLIYFHEQMSEALRELEAKWGHTEDLEATRTPVGRDGTSEQHADGARFPVDDSPAALADMRCYVRFITEEIKPLYSQFDKLDETSPAKVRFFDLWFLFRTGELIFRPITTGTENDNSLLIGQRIWRTYGVRPFWPKYRITPVDHPKYIKNDADEENASFGVLCYYIDYTGDEFCVVKEKFEIPPYEGERLITSLNIFPLRFNKNHEETLREHKKIGEDFLHYIEARHGAYNWWTLTRNPRGDPALDAEGNIVKHPEHVNSEVIVDFVEAFQTCPSWKPQRSILKHTDPSSSTTTDEFYICLWSDADRTKLLAEATEIIVLKSGVFIYERNKYVQEDQFLASVRENDKNNRLITAKDLRDCDLPLLPLRVFAYVLQDRKFVMLNVQKLRQVKESYNAFDYLKINPRYKSTVQALVEAHFLKKTTEKTDGVEGMTQDLIQGKGKGLFILLHGVPGVGKTATAEAVAQANGKPLFAITCGDLGLTPNKVESALRRIFRLAHLWDCVLLLDEVDTFFSQRSKGDATLTKNALVSVFLRVLEYYNGILFLTTNRPGALDEAFKSRIHLKLYYPPLEFDQTKDIWQMNIQRLRIIEEQRCEGTDELPLQIYEQEIMDFAIKQFYQHGGKCRWNGRQIRNAFQIASSLAYFDARKKYKELIESHPDTPIVRPKLDVEHFQMIYHITDDFDQYMEETVGKTDGEQAFERDDRADHWGPRQSSSDNLQYFGYGTSSHSQGGGRSWGGWNGNNGNGLTYGHRYSHSSGQGPLGNISSFDDNLGSPPNRPGLQFQAHSPNPSQQRPPMRGGPSSFSLKGPQGLSENREYGLHRGLNGQGSSIGYDHRNSEHMSSGFPNGPSGQGSSIGYDHRNSEHTSLGFPQVPGGSFGYGREGNERQEFRPHNQGSGHGYGSPNE